MTIEMKKKGLKPSVTYMGHSVVFGPDKNIAIYNVPKTCAHPIKLFVSASSVKYNSI